MNRGVTIFLVAAALAAAVFAALYVPFGRRGGKPVGSALLDFDPGEVRLIKITNGDKIFELKKSEDGWMIGPEPADRASVDAIKRLIEAARSTPVLDRIERSEIGDRDQLAEYGLRKSSVQFDIKGDVDHPLLIGKDAADESRVYVRFEDSRDVYLIPDDLVRMILSPAQDYRDRMPVRLRPDRVDRVVIRRPAGEIELRREAGGWAIVKPLSAPAGPEAVEGFLEKLFRTRIEGFEPEQDPAWIGLAEPVAEVRAYGEGEALPESILVGAAAPQGGHYAKLVPRGVTVRMPDSIMDLLSVDPTSFRDPAIARINPDLVDMIRISGPEGTFELRRSELGWKIGGQEVPADRVQVLASRLASARATRYEAATDATLARAGLKSPQLKIGFFAVVSENTPESPAGAQLISELELSQGPQEAAVHAAGSPEVLFTGDRLIDAIPSTPSAWLKP